MFGGPVVQVGDLDGAANVRSEVVLNVNRCALAFVVTGDPIPGRGIQRCVPRVFKRSSVVLRAAGLGDNRNLGGCGSAILGIVIRGDDLNFLNHIRR